MDLDQLREEMKKPGRTQGALAKALGIDTSGVSKLLAGKRDLKAREIPIVEAYLESTERDQPSRSIVTERMMERCEALGLTPITAATRAGFQRDLFRNIARGGEPTTSTLMRMAQALSTSMSYLIGETDDPGLGAPPAKPKANPSDAISMTANGDGFATLEIRKRVPMSIAVKILELLEGGA